MRMLRSRRVSSAYVHIAVQMRDNNLCKLHIRYGFLRLSASVGLLCIRADMDAECCLCTSRTLVRVSLRKNDKATFCVRVRSQPLRENVVMYFSKDQSFACTQREKKRVPEEDRSYGRTKSSQERRKVTYFILYPPKYSVSLRSAARDRSCSVMSGVYTPQTAIETNQILWSASSSGPGC